MASSTFRARDRGFQSGCARVAVALRQAGTGPVAARNGRPFPFGALARSVLRWILQDAVEPPADCPADQGTDDPDEDIGVERAADESRRKRTSRIDRRAAERDPGKVDRAERQRDRER